MPSDPTTTKCPTCNGSGLINEAPPMWWLELNYLLRLGKPAWGGLLKRGISEREVAADDPDFAFNVAQGHIERVGDEGWALTSKGKAVAMTGVIAVTEHT